MLQLILGYTFATLTGLLALAMFTIMFTDKRLAAPGFFMFVMCAVLSVLFAWMAGV